MPSQRITGLVVASMGLAASSVSAQTYFGGEDESEIRSWDETTTYFSISGLLVAPQDSDLSATDEFTNDLLRPFSPSMEFDLSAGVSLALGRKITRNFRSEIQYSYMDIQMDAVSTTAGSLQVENGSSLQTLMLNVYYDFPFTVRFKPYLGVGAGVAFHWSEFSTESNPNIQFNIERSWDETAALQFMAGVGYDLNRQVSLSAGVRYLVTDDPEFDVISMESTTIVFEFGVRFGF